MRRAAGVRSRARGWPRFIVPIAIRRQPAPTHPQPHPSHIDEHALPVHGHHRSAGARVDHADLRAWLQRRIGGRTRALPGRGRLLQRPNRVLHHSARLAGGFAQRVTLAHPLLKAGDRRVDLRAGPQKHAAGFAPGPRGVLLLGTAHFLLARLQLRAQGGRAFLLALQLGQHPRDPAFLPLQGFQKVVHPRIGGVAVGVGAGQDLVREPQAARDREAVAASRTTLAEPVGGQETLAVEVQRRVYDAVAGRGEALESAQVRGHDGGASPLGQRLHEGARQGLALLGIGARAGLVDEDEGPRTRLLQDRAQAPQMGGEGRQAVGDGLTVTRLGKEGIEDGQPGPGPRRRNHPRLGQHRHQPDRPQEDRLAAGVRAGHDHHPLVGAEV